MLTWAIDDVSNKSLFTNNNLLFYYCTLLDNKIRYMEVPLGSLILPSPNKLYFIWSEKASQLCHEKPARKWRIWSKMFGLTFSLECVCNSYSKNVLKSIIGRVVFPWGGFLSRTFSSTPLFRSLSFCRDNKGRAALPMSKVWIFGKIQLLPSIKLF